MISVKRHLHIGLLLMALFSCLAQAQEQRLEMEGTAIIGNKELPKVLYIVPWKPAQRIEIPTPPLQSVLERPLQTIERKTFRRQVKYYQAIFADSNTQQ